MHDGVAPDREAAKIVRPMRRFAGNAALQECIQPISHGRQQAEVRCFLNAKPAAALDYAATEIPILRRLAGALRNSPQRIDQFTNTELLDAGRYSQFGRCGRTRQAAPR